MIKDIIRDLWLCQDCTMAAVNGDFTGLDYYLSEKQAAARQAEIERGLDALPGLVCDASDDQWECNECGHIQDVDQFAVRVENEGTDYEESFRECPECHSYDTRERESGEDEFSRRDCDCCGDDLAGHRMRFAQLIESDTSEGQAP